MLTPKEELFISQHKTDDVKKIALSIKPKDEIRKDIVLRQINGLQITKCKVPSWHETKGLLFPVHLSLEQCSSETTALYKQSIVGSGKTHIDLTGGMGVDFIFMSHYFDNAIYVEQSAELCELAHHNFKLLRNKTTHIVCKDCTSFINELTERVDSIFIDPARRNQSGNKTVRIADCTPDLSIMEKLLVTRCKRAIAKLSPMLDISDALNTLRYVSEIHIISTDNECKELLLIMEETTSETISIHTVNITNKHTQLFILTTTEEANASCTYTDTLQEFLFEPNSSILKAGAFKAIANRFNITKLHPNSHLYTNDTPIDNFPGRCFKIIDTFGFSKTDIAALTKTYPQANISVRNFPLRPDELRKKLKIKDGGDIFIFATTTNNNKHVLAICKKTTS